MAAILPPAGADPTKPARMRAQRYLLQLMSWDMRGLTKEQREAAKAAVASATGSVMRAQCDAFLAGALPNSWRTALMGSYYLG